MNLGIAALCVLGIGALVIWGLWLAEWVEDHWPLLSQ